MSHEMPIFSFATRHITSLYKNIFIYMVYLYSNIKKRSHLYFKTDKFFSINDYKSIETKKKL